MIYLDNAATTKISYKVSQAMEPYLNEIYGNPSGVYGLSRKSKEAIENSREIIAETLGCNANNIIFTSGGTESNNWVLDNVKEGEHLITSSIEHHAILNKCSQLEEKGVEVTYLPVNRWGRVNVKDVENNIKSNTTLVSIMMANNEIGTIEPISEIGKLLYDNKKYLLRDKFIKFHTDAVQAYGHIYINVDDQNIDFLSASSHKFNGPKGVGFLYIRDTESIKPMIYGGGQERGLRSGTENVANIVGMATAAKEATRELAERNKKEVYMRNYFISRVMREVPRVRLNGAKDNRLPGNISLSFEGVKASDLVTEFDREDICVSSGSACSSGNGALSHVLQSINAPKNYAYGTVRFTLNHENTVDELNYVIYRLKENVKKMRNQH